LSEQTGEPEDQAAKAKIARATAGRAKAARTNAAKAKAEKLAKARRENREDFMKRWFAIAISVGFATALSNMPWLRDKEIFESSLPVDWDQVKQVARLAAAAVATIMSWEGYLQSIATKPLGDQRRFYIDVFLVFLYLFLLLTSKFSFFWLYIHVSAFVLYIAWDYLSVREHPSEYVPGYDAEQGPLPSRKEIYRRAFKGDPAIYHGPVVTLLWPLYFAALPVTYHFVLPTRAQESAGTTIAYAVLVICGLLSYRGDKLASARTPKERLRRVFGGVLAILGVDAVLWLN
jgi:hypothetical protein